MPALRLVLLLTVALAALAGCERPTPALPAPRTSPLRLVTQSPAAGVTLRDLGLERLVAGRASQAWGLHPSLPVVGDFAQIDYEAMLRLEPTHVVLQWGSRPLPEQLTTLAGRHGWAIVRYEPLTLDEVTTAVESLEGRFAGAIDEECRAAGRDAGPSLSRRMREAFVRRGGGFARAGRVLLLESTSPPAALGPGSFHHDILERIGGTPALVGGGAFVRLDAEEVLRIAPDAIVLVMPSPSRLSPMPETRDRPRLDMEAALGTLHRLDVPAVRGGKVAVIDGELVLLPASSLIEFADRLAEVLDGWSR